MGGTRVSPLHFVAGITEKCGAKSCDLKIHLQQGIDQETFEVRNERDKQLEENHE